MRVSLEAIKKTILDKVEKNISGYIKLGFEGGQLVAANLYSNPTDEERKFLAATSDFDLEKELETATKSTFYGTLGFIFDDKKITNNYRSQSWKGSTLELFMRG